MSRCASCGAKIVWAQTDSGRKMPVDADPHPAGNVLLEKDPGGLWTARVLRVFERADGRPVHRSHFASCTDASKWRRR